VTQQVIRSYRQRNTGMKAFFVLGAVVAVSAMLSLGAAAQTTLQVAVVWGEDTQEWQGFLAAGAAFERLHPGVKVEFLPVMGWLGSNTEQTARLMTRVAGGVSPDVTLVDGMMVPQYAHAGLLLPLDKYIEASGVVEQDFIPAAWRQTQWLGRQYAMTLHVDPNFPLVWNKEMFARAGLDADRGPETLAEYEEYFRKLTRIENDRAVQFGHRLWDVYGGANTIYTWGWIFGGDFYDFENVRITAADPRNVEALEFIRDYYQRYQAYLTPEITFPTGMEAMRFATAAAVQQWRERYPDIGIGASFMPYAESGSPNPAWIGGHAIGILPDAPNPDLAWEFIRFITATEEGTLAFASASGAIPAYLPSPAHLAFLEDPITTVYLEIAQRARNVRPAVPVIADYGVYLDEAFNSVLNGLQQPADALAYVQRQVQMQLDEVLAGVR